MQNHAGIQYLDHLKSKSHPFYNVPPKIEMISCFCNKEGFNEVKNVVLGKTKTFKVVNYDGKVHHLTICKDYVEL